MLLLAATSARSAATAAGSLSAAPNNAQATSAAVPSVPGELLIQLKPGVQPAGTVTASGRIQRRLLTVSAQMKRVVSKRGKGDLVLVSLPQGQTVEDAITLLKQSPDVQFVEPNLKYMLVSLVTLRS